MSRRMWKVVEVKAGKVRMAEVKGGGKSKKKKRSEKRKKRRKSKSQKRRGWRNRRYRTK